VKALFIQHDHVSPLGPVGERFRFHGFETVEQNVVSEENYYSPNVHFEFPNVDDYDVIVPMGSPWGVWDNACIGNWLEPELDWIRAAIETGKPVFGICFGGQLIARAMGGTVAKGPKFEVGWTSIWSEEPALVSNGPWFQYHYDRWTLPEGAREIARNPVASQAFVINKALALQFHPEMVSTVLQPWFEWDGAEEIRADGQDPEIMMAQTIAIEAEAKQRTYNLVDAFLSKVAGLI
jgi:GMP synthase-like glutamine amidotransferase